MSPASSAGAIVVTPVHAGVGLAEQATDAQGEPVGQAEHHHHRGERAGAGHHQPQVGRRLAEQRERDREDHRQRLPRGAAAGDGEVAVDDLAAPHQPGPRVIARRRGDQQRERPDGERDDDQAEVEVAAREQRRDRPRRGPAGGARAPAPAGKSVVEAEAALATGRRAISPRLPWPRSARPRTSGCPRPGWDTRAALPMISAPCASPWICTPWASPGVGSKLTVGPAGAVPTWKLGRILPAIVRCSRWNGDMGLLEAGGVLAARVVETLVTVGDRLRRAGLRLGGDPAR